MAVNYEIYKAAQPKKRVNMVAQNLAFTKCAGGTTYGVPQKRHPIYSVVAPKACGASAYSREFVFRAVLQGKQFVNA